MTNKKLVLFPLLLIFLCLVFYPMPVVVVSNSMPSLQLIESMHLVALNSDLVNVKYSQDFIGRLASFCNKNVVGSTRDLGIDRIAQEESIDSHTELIVEVEPTYIIFSTSRGGLFPNPAVFVNNTINYISSSPIFEGITTQELHDMLALGVGFCIRSSSLKLLLGGQCTDILVSLSGIQSVVFENQVEYTTMLSSLPYNKNQFIITECTFHLRAGPTKGSLTIEKMEDESSSGRVSDSLGICYSTEIEFTEVYIGDYRVHNYLTEVNQPSRQKISLLIDDNLQIFKCKIQVREINILSQLFPSNTFSVWFNTKTFSITLICRVA